MKKSLRLMAVLSATAPLASGQSVTFYNELRQVQFPTGVERSVPLATLEGQRESELAIDPGGARFELWTFAENDLATRYLLDHKYVSTYTPVAEVRIATEDPYDVIPRTRADRPFNVTVTPSGLLPADMPDTPDASKMVTLTRHAQSYGIEGIGENLDRSQATLLNQVTLNENKTHWFQYSITSIPGADRTKIRGEERFTVYSLDHHQEDYNVDASQIATLTMQVWPVAEGSISGINNGDVLRFNTPQITLNYIDLYPDSGSYAQLYPGLPVLGTEGKVISGSFVPGDGRFPVDRTLVLDRWDTQIDQDGQWTMELLTKTPFDIDRLAYVTFTINRSIEVQGSVTTSD